MIEIKGLSKSFGSGKNRKDIFQNIFLSIKKNEAIALVGESGCGKSTFAKSITGIIPFDNGDIIINERSVSNLSNKDRKILMVKTFQYIFQNPEESLHPLKKIKTIFKESHKSYQKLTGDKNDIDFSELLKMVNMSAHDLNKYPKDFSGGECQRIAIARAFITKPFLLIADEPISSSDILTQATLINLFKKLKNRGSALFFITHNIEVAKYIADRILIMKDNNIYDYQTETEIIKK
ncbi:MAG: dipeptide/oligopeptide/nickel ABC transporter ATP-binding protein [Candidatus Cloacimonetes bacterium]|nr:dipeptide/oligopeptide/nickel ABC transporter ATP-binding protein [Candidatus Cloacimonadota bacterium]